MSGVLSSVKTRLLQAVGIDPANSTSLVSWLAFLQLYCIFESGELDVPTLSDIWVKYFDP